MRPIERGPAPVDESTGAACVFTDYAQARPHLVERLGGYCSYCGMRMDGGVQVEHIRPKSLYPEKEREWDNLLIACGNCNPTKGATDVVLDDYYWPDIDNPMCFIEYGPGALVRPAEGRGEVERARAARTLSLTGLDCRPGRTKLRTASDRRWEKRQAAWDGAQLALRRLAEADGEALRAQIIDTATRDGYWAVWYTAFVADPDLRRRLIHAVEGTCETCFNEDGDPIPRSKGRWARYRVALSVRRRRCVAAAPRPLRRRP